MKTDYEFSWPFAYLKPFKRLHLSRIFRSSRCRKWVQLDFRHFETSIHWLNQTRFLRRPECRLWVGRAIRLHKTSFPRLCPNCFFECSECRKYVLMAFRHHETLLHRHHQSRTLRRPDSKFWVIRPILLLKISVKWLHSSCFIRCSGCRKWFRMAFWHLEKSLHRLHQSRFFRRPQGTSWVFQGHLPT
jgi:hypothetical protein